VQGCGFCRFVQVGGKGIGQRGFDPVLLIKLGGGLVWNWARVCWIRLCCVLDLDFGLRFSNNK
jgi:hypothetical protein